MLRDALLETPATGADIVAQQRMREMYELIELSSSWFDDVQRLSPETLTSLMKMGSTVGKLHDVSDSVRATFRKKSSDKLSEKPKDPQDAPEPAPGE